MFDDRRLPSDAAFDIAPTDALAAMLEVQQGLSKANRRLKEVVRELEQANSDDRDTLRLRFEKLIAMVAARAAQVQYLGQRYREARRRSGPTFWSHTT